MFRCYLRNKTHLVKALRRNPAHTITTSPKTLTGWSLHTWTNTTIWKYEARPDTYQVSVYWLQHWPRSSPKSHSEASGSKVMRHVQQVQKRLLFIFNVLFFFFLKNQSLPNLSPIILSLLPCDWPPGWSVLRSHNDGLCVWLLKMGEWGVGGVVRGWTAGGKLLLLHLAFLGRTGGEVGRVLCFVVFKVGSNSVGHTVWEEGKSRSRSKSVSSFFFVWCWKLEFWETGVMTIAF